MNMSIIYLILIVAIVAFCIISVVLMRINARLTKMMLKLSISKTSAPTLKSKKFEPMATKSKKFGKDFGVKTVEL